MMPPENDSGLQFFLNGEPISELTNTEFSFPPVEDEKPLVPKGITAYGELHLVDKLQKAVNKIFAIHQHFDERVDYLAMSHHYSRAKWVIEKRDRMTNAVLRRYTPQEKIFIIDAVDRKFDTCLPNFMRKKKD